MQQVTDLSAPDSTTAPMWSHTALALLVCGFVALLDGADAQSLAIAAPLLAKTLAMPSSSVGWMFSLTALGSGLGYLGGGLLADRWGAKPVVTLCTVVIGSFQLLTNLAGDVSTLVVIRFVVSLGLGGAVPGLVTLVSQVSPNRLQHRFVGLLWAFFPIGVLSGGIISGWILDHSRWQNIFVVGGIAPLVIALALWRTIPRVTHPSSVRRDTTPSFRDVVATVPWVLAILTALVFFFTNGAIAVVMNWTPSLLVRSGFQPSVGAQALAWNAAGALLSMSVTGFIVERFRIAQIVVGLAVATVGTVLLSSFLASLWTVRVLMVVLGSGLALAGTSAVFVAGSLIPGERRATGIGACMAVGRIGQTIFPALVGWSLEAGDLPGGALLWCAALPTAGCIAAVALAFRLQKST